MHMLLRFAYLDWLYIAFPFFILILYMRYYYTRLVLYQFPLFSYVTSLYTSRFKMPMYVLYMLRFLLLFLLVLLLGKPQIVDQKSQVTVEGIDIMMVLDISGSMACFDDIKDRRTRVTIAKKEAIRFVEKRHNDAIGLVVFGSYPLMKCPITPDKVMLKSMLDALSIRNGDSIHDGTVISQAVITAAKHLQKSKAASRIIILLTDGAPSSNDFHPAQAIEIAKAFGIKIYTIGIGNHGLSMQEDPLLGVVQYQNNFDTTLLELFAHETGGTFFDARKAQDIARIYDEIDRLEKSKYQDTIYMKHHDFFLPIIWIALFVIIIELILSTFVWAIL